MRLGKLLVLICMLIVIILTFYFNVADNDNGKAMAASQIQEDSPVGKILQGEHQLRKMIAKDGNESNLNGGFFLIAGWLNSKNENVTNVTFSWLMNDGTYAISSLPIESFRIRFDETKEAPIIKFRWRPSSDIYYGDNVQGIMNNCIIYAMVVCREKDWPTDINLPLNQEK